MTMQLKKIFEEWTGFTENKFSDRQWLLAKWEVSEGVVWPKAKIDVMIKTILQRLDLRFDHTLIDLGCGGGWILDLLSGRVQSAVGLDFSWGMIQNAAVLVPRNRLIQGAIGELPFKDGTFDRILCYFVLINVLDDTDVERFLVDMFRVLKPGGRLLVGQMPDRAGSKDYDSAKVEYFDYCRSHYQLGDCLRDQNRIPQKLFDVLRLRAFLDSQKIRYEICPSFNPFYRPGEPETVTWRFDLVLYKD
ncbi:MAG: class I SAM-dependent methyltransferase [Candidatus Omnitrophica bacterium]|nr:class I SAM-dependent methyltransferase [Candidatus Omnitrophota bacterium]